MGCGKEHPWDSNLERCPVPEERPGQQLGKEREQAADGPGGFGTGLGLGLGLAGWYSPWSPGEGLSQGEHLLCQS